MGHLKRLISQSPYTIRTKDVSVATMITLSIQRFFVSQPV
jgi:hypothetical protein